ncbi:hypothetical protein POHY109586_18925 [Polaromonas hydrogenivorans]
MSKRYQGKLAQWHSFPPKLRSSVAMRHNQTGLLGTAQLHAS